MKNSFIAVFCVLCTYVSNAQGSWVLDFDSNPAGARIEIDSNGVWQVGQPSKTVFNSAFSSPRAIITDSLNPISTNDTSTFYVKHWRPALTPMHVFALGFKFQLDGDSTDFGIIEMSVDTGKTWINLLTDDVAYGFVWQSPKPALKGSTSGWQTFELHLDHWVSFVDPDPNLPDTTLFRFTYITDSVSTPRDGWIIDDIYMMDWFQGIEEFNNPDLISIFPNPAKDKLTIQKEISRGDANVQILNASGQVIYNSSPFTEESINTTELEEGFYLLKYSDSEEFAIKKFFVNH